MLKKTWLQISYIKMFRSFFDMCLTKFKNNQILLNKINHWYLVTAKLFTEWNIPIQPSWNLRVEDFHLQNWCGIIDI